MACNWAAYRCRASGLRRGCLHSWRIRNSVDCVDGLRIAALGGGTTGPVGGILWDWGATGNAARAALKIVTATKNDRDDLEAITRRERDLKLGRVSGEPAQAE